LVSRLRGLHCLFSNPHFSLSTKREVPPPPPPPPPSLTTVQKGQSWIDRCRSSSSDWTKLIGDKTLFTNLQTFDRCLEGLTLTAVDRDNRRLICELELQPQPSASSPPPLPPLSLSNSSGRLHGGVSATLVDVVGSLVILSVSSVSVGVSVEINCSYLNPVQFPDKLRIEGKLLKLGKKLAFTQVDIYRESDGALVATGRHTKAM